MEKEELGIYIHIPFCKSKCYYCDFTSYTDKDNQQEEYIKKVIEEMDEYHFRRVPCNNNLYRGRDTFLHRRKIHKESPRKIKRALIKQ